MDLRPLRCLPKLRALHLISGRLEFIRSLRLLTLAPLSGVHTLRDLSLGHTTIRDLGPLRRLTQMTNLSLHASPVSDLQPLARLTSLRELDLSQTRVTDLRPLRSMRQLVKLDLTGTGVTDLTPLAQLKRLRWLGLHPKSAVPEAQLVALRKRLPKLTISVGRTY